jgi:hypothetical protein
VEGEGGSHGGRVCSVHTQIRHVQPRVGTAVAIAHLTACHHAAALRGGGAVIVAAVATILLLVREE